MDLKEIFRNDKLLEFWPSSKQPAKDRVASTVRFVLYACVLVYILTRDARIMVMGGLVIGTLFVLDKNGMVFEGVARPTARDGRMFKDVSMPTPNNPWMNPLITDYTDDPDRAPAAFYPTVREEIGEIWDEIHPHIRQKDAMRNFYTVPGNTFPNDQTAFAQAAYGVPFSPQCHDTPMACDPDRMPYGRGQEQFQMRAGSGGSAR
jgi:hypothetical protein